MSNTLKKKERLHSKKLIDQLFKEGQYFYIKPFKVMYLTISGETQYPVQLLITVSKRNLKNAVDRNKTKRIIREAYRLNKDTFYKAYNKGNEQLLLGLIYTGKTIPSFDQIESKIILILQRLNEQDEQVVG